MKALFFGRNKIGLILLLLASLLFSSCFKDGLEEDTRGILGTETFYKSESDFEAALMAVYRYFQYPFGFPQGQITMFGGDDITTRPGSNKEQIREWDLFDYNPGSGWMEEFAYQPYWQTIYAANTIINTIDEVSNEDVSEDFKKEILGQTHFLRGLSYYMLVRQFGGMPVIESAETTGEEVRGTVLENYKLIEEDLKYAAQNLPETWSAKNGRATSGAAYTVLASLYLTWAGWPLKDDSKYALSADMAKKVIESNVYDLLDNYEDLWKQGNDFNKEVIFTIVWDREADDLFNFIPQGYASIEEKGWNDAYSELTLFRRMPSGPRKEATYQTEYENLAGDGEMISWEDAQFKHPTFKKWVVGGSPQGTTPYFYGVNSIPLFRYAEVLLTFAEADAMAKGSPSGEAYSAVNQVRMRAGIGDLTSGLSSKEFQDSLVEERAFEFAGEYTRWFDEVRTEIVEEYSGNMRDPGEIPLRNQPSEKYYISPIPQVEISRNPNIIQNPEGNIIE